MCACLGRMRAPAMPLASLAQLASMLRREHQVARPVTLEAILQDRPLGVLLVKRASIHWQQVHSARHAIQVIIPLLGIRAVLHVLLAHSQPSQVLLNANHAPRASTKRTLVRRTALQQAQGMSTAIQARPHQLRVGLVHIKTKRGSQSASPAVMDISCQLQVNTNAYSTPLVVLARR